MNAAIYARKSTEQADDVSVERQVELARAFATTRGWTVADEHVYVDPGVSGTEYIKRPEYLRMMEAALVPAFSVLIVMEQSRLGRDTGRVLLAIQALEEAGVEIWSYQSGGTRISVENESGEVNVTVLSLVDKIHNRQASKRTREALREKAKAGYVTGGQCYGYSTHRDGSHVVREINEPEAIVVRHIFQMAADGKGLQKIAKALTAENVPGPRRHGWSLTGVREMLHRDLYRGRIVYGATKWAHRGGTKKKLAAPASDLITVDAPHLRIVPETLWKAAHDRIARTYEVYLRQNNGRLYGKPESGLESNYLLSGFLKCGLCGGNLVVIRRTGKQRRTKLVFVCGAHRTGACSNKYEIGLNEITEAILGHFKQEFLHPAALGKLLMQEWKDRAEEPERIATERKAVESALRGIETKLQNLVNAVAAGGDAKPLVVAIKKLEQERADLHAKLEHLQGLDQAREDFDLATWLEEIKEVLADLKGTLEGAPQAGRQIIRRLLDGPITVTPRTDSAGGLIFEYAGVGRFDSALKKFDRMEEIDPDSVKSAPQKRILVGQIRRTNMRARPGY